MRALLAVGMMWLTGCKAICPPPACYVPEPVRASDEVKRWLRSCPAPTPPVIDYFDRIGKQQEKLSLQ